MAAAPAPAPNKQCTCGQRMKWYGPGPAGVNPAGHWKCVNIKVHDRAVSAGHGNGNR